MNTAILLPPITPYNAPWTDLYAQGIVAGFRAERWEVLQPERDRITEWLQQEDRLALPCIVQSPWDVETYASLVPGIKLYAHLHGTPCVPLGNWTFADRRLEESVVSRCRAVFTCSAYTQGYVTREYESLTTLCVAAGFPLIPPRPRQARPRDTIVVPGRLDIERVPNVLLEALHPLDADIVFCTPQTQHESSFGRWMKDAYLEYPEFARVRFEYGTTMDGYLKLLDRALCVVIGSQYDNLNVSAAQAAHLGVPVVAPNSGSFPEFLDWKFLYEPHYCRSIRSNAAQAILEASARVPTGLISLTSPARVAGRYIKVIEAVHS